MSKIFKLGLGSLGWQWGLFEFSISSFSENDNEENKKTFIKGIQTAVAAFS